MNKEEVAKILCRIIALDRSKNYKYGEKRPFDDKHPGPGQRWITPTEFARAWLKNEKLDEEKIREKMMG